MREITIFQSKIKTMANKSTSYKACWCVTCGKAFHSLGIARHRAMHRDKKQNCTIIMENQFKTYKYKYGEV